MRRFVFELHGYVYTIILHDHDVGSLARKHRVIIVNTIWQGFLVNPIHKMILDSPNDIALRVETEIVEMLLKSCNGIFDKRGRIRQHSWLQANYRADWP